MRSSRGRRTAIPAGFVMDYVVDVTSDRTGSYNNELAFEPPSDKGNYFFQSNRDRRGKVLGKGKKRTIMHRY